MLIKPDELQEKLRLKNAIPLCCLLPPVGSAAPAKNTVEFISSSRIFDIDEFSNSGSEFPHMLLSPKAFEEKARELGIDNESEVFVYDNIGIYSAPRVWFNLALMGCKNVFVLDGGLPNWKAHSYPVVAVTENITGSGNFAAHLVSDMLSTREDVLDAIENPNSIIVDVRSSGRFAGLEPEPRKGVRSGHIPGSANIHFARFIDGNCFKQKDDLVKIFEEAGCDKSNELIFSCGSGVTACIGYFAARLCGYKNIKVYDGSWAEWGSIESLPIEI